MNSAILQYFDRAAWALHNATHDALPPKTKSHLTAMAVHACQSLRESLLQLAHDETQPDTKLKAAINSLPHAQLIDNIRNMDLHGWPLPVCDPKVRVVTMVSKPGHPIGLSSSHGVGVSLQMDGPTPKVRRTPKDLKHGTVTFGASVSYECDQGQLIVHDLSKGKAYRLLGILKSFLQHCHGLIKDETTATNMPPGEPCEDSEGK